MKFDFWFSSEYLLSDIDAYFIGNLFSYNYMNRDGEYVKQATFMSIKRKQTNNSTGWEYSIAGFNSYKKNIMEMISLDPKYKEIKISILDYDDKTPDDLKRKKRSNERMLYIVFPFENKKTYKDLVMMATIKINTPSLLISFIRGAFDSRGSADFTGGFLTVDMDSFSSSQQSNILNYKIKEHLKGTSEKLNYNPRNKQPNSKNKNPQMRFNLNYYMSNIGTANPQLAERFFLISEGDIEFSKEKELYIFDGNFNFGRRQKNKDYELNIDDKLNLERKFSNVNYKTKYSNYDSPRKFLKIQEKEMLWKENFGFKTIDGKIADFGMLNWHHAIPEEQKRKTNSELLIKFINSCDNFIPLMPNEHTLIHKKDESLSEIQKELKEKILNTIFKYIELNIDNLISEETFLSFYS